VLLCAVLCCAVLCCAVLCFVSVCISGTPLGLMQDSSSGSVLLWSGDALHEVSLSNEGKDMWRTYLDYQVGAGDGAGEKSIF
jgi:hypothetical protein